ncbi:MAG: AmmeMemoRadiSam system protein B [Desulfomonilia bacterium]
MKHPKLRSDIQVIPVMVDGQQMISFIDPLKLSQGLAMDRSAVFVLQLLDGTHDLLEIQVEMIRRSGGQLIPLSDIEAFIKGLDEALLLESDTFHARKNSIREAFLCRPDRDPYLAGKSYDQEPRALKRFIQDTEAELPPCEDEQAQQVDGIIAPHIDINVAKKAYVDLYRRVKGMHFDRVIIFGINHQGGDGLYSISTKHYQTPFGTLETDVEFVSQLKARGTHGTFTPDDFDHMSEHSIEFQAIFLHHYLGHEFRIVPILCGGIHEFILGNRDMLRDDRFVSFREALSDLIQKGDLKTLLVAGVDFSHVGLKFGHSVPASQLVSRALKDDETLISCLRTCDAKGIFSHASTTRDQFNVCGLPAMILFSSLLQGCSGRLLMHETYDEQATQSMVTYASMMFTRP